MDQLAWKEKVPALLKKYRYFLLVLLVGLMLMCLPERGEGADETAAVTASPVEDISMEQRLEEILGQIRGAGRVRVMLTEETGAEADAILRCFREYRRTNGQTTRGHWIRETE